MPPCTVLAAPRQIIAPARVSVPAAKCARRTAAVRTEEVGFGGATQVGPFRTSMRGCGRSQRETRCLMSRASHEQLNALGLLDAKRG